MGVRRQLRTTSFFFFPSEGSTPWVESRLSSQCWLPYSSYKLVVIPAPLPAPFQFLISKSMCPGPPGRRSVRLACYFQATSPLGVADFCPSFCHDYSLLGWISWNPLEGVGTDRGAVEGGGEGSKATVGTRWAAPEGEGASLLPKDLSFVLGWGSVPVPAVIASRCSGLHFPRHPRPPGVKSFFFFLH